MTASREPDDRSQRDRRQRERATPAWATEPNSPRALTTALLSVGGAMAATLLVIVVAMSGVFETLFEPPLPTPQPTLPPVTGVPTPAATPLASPPAEPAGDGTRAVIQTELGDIVVELFTESAPVASENFLNLARAGYYDGVVFHRVVPDFVIQAGDRGDGGPGFTIRDEPVVGEYERGILAMARPGGLGGSLIPDSQGSQFFIVLADLRERLPKAGGYVIFGRVADEESMETVDAIAAQEVVGERPTDPIEIITVSLDGAP